MSDHTHHREEDQPCYHTGISHGAKPPQGQMAASIPQSANHADLHPNQEDDHQLRLGGPDPHKQMK